MTAQAIDTWVVCTGEPPAISPLPASDPALKPRDHALRSVPSTQSEQHAQLHFLAQRILRNPRDMLAHTQRIFLTAAIENHHHCFAALVDLYIAAGSQATALRKTLLAQHRHCLSDREAAYLYRHLATGLSPDALSGLDGALLVTPKAQIKAFVALEDGPAETSASTIPNRLRTVATLLENGQIDAARCLLEQRLEQDPGDSLTTLELLSLYRDQQLCSAFRATYARLLGRRLALPELWEKVDHELREHGQTTSD